MMFGELEGSLLFIAGVGPQMGQATARIAARDGAKVILGARSRNKDLAAEIRDLGGVAIAIACDPTDRASLKAAVEQGAATLGRIDKVFYNAGYYDNEHDDIEVEDDIWQATMDVNFNDAHSLARLTIPAMIEHGGGAFVFNSSAASLVGGQVRFGYQVAKAGVNAPTRFIAATYRRRNIRANATLPFVVSGEVGAIAGTQNGIGRSGTAEEIGEAVTFLLSDRASWPTNAAPISRQRSGTTPTDNHNAHEEER